MSPKSRPDPKLLVFSLPEQDHPILSQPTTVLNSTPTRNSMCNSVCLGIRRAVGNTSLSKSLHKLPYSLARTRARVGAKRREEDIRNKRPNESSVDTLVDACASTERALTPTAPESNHSLLLKLKFSQFNLYINIQTRVAQ